MTVGSEPTDAQASDYQTLSKAGARLNPAVLFAPTCMIWCIALGIGLLVAMVIFWAIQYIGTLDFSLLFR